MMQLQVESPRSTQEEGQSDDLLNTPSRQIISTTSVKCTAYNLEINGNKICYDRQYLSSNRGSLILSVVTENTATMQKSQNQRNEEQEKENKEQSHLELSKTKTIFAPFVPRPKPIFREIPRTKQINELDSRIWTKKFIFDLVSCLETCSVSDAVFLIKRIPTSVTKFVSEFLSRISLPRICALLKNKDFFIAIFQCLQKITSKKKNMRNFGQGKVQTSNKQLQQIAQRLKQPHQRMFYILDNLVLEKAQLQRALQQTTFELIKREMRKPLFLEKYLFMSKGNSSQNDDDEYLESGYSSEQKDSDHEFDSDQNNTKDLNDSISTDPSDSDSERRLSSVQNGFNKNGQNRKKRNSRIDPENFFLNTIKVVNSCRKVSSNRCGWSRDEMNQVLFNKKYFKYFRVCFYLSFLKFTGKKTGDISTSKIKVTEQPATIKTNLILKVIATIFEYNCEGLWTNVFQYNHQPKHKQRRNAAIPFLNILISNYILKTSLVTTPMLLLSSSASSSATQKIEEEHFDENHSQKQQKRKCQNRHDSRPEKIQQSTTLKSVSKSKNLSNKRIAPASSTSTSRAGSRNLRSSALYSTTKFNYQKSFFPLSSSTSRFSNDHELLPDNLMNSKSSSVSQSLKNNCQQKKMAKTVDKETNNQEIYTEQQEAMIQFSWAQLEQILAILMNYSDQEKDKRICQVLQKSFNLLSKCKQTEQKVRLIHGHLQFILIEKIQGNIKKFNIQVMQFVEKQITKEMRNLFNADNDQSDQISIKYSNSNLNVLMIIRRNKVKIVYLLKICKLLIQSVNCGYCQIFDLQSFLFQVDRLVQRTVNVKTGLISTARLEMLREINSFRDQNRNQSREKMGISSQQSSDQFQVTAEI